MFYLFEYIDRAVLIQDLDRYGTFDVFATEIPGGDGERFGAVQVVHGPGRLPAVDPGAGDRIVTQFDLEFEQGRIYGAGAGLRVGEFPHDGGLKKGTGQ